jgi:signal peptidase II
MAPVRDRRRPRRPPRTLVGVVAIVIAIDQLTKALAVQLLAGRGYVHVAGPLHLTLYRNFAGSGNRLTGHPVLVSLLAIVAVILIAGLATTIRSRVNLVAAGLLLGGGVSNLLDRLLRAPGPLRGGVVDWIKPTPHGGTMNLADVAITAGVALFVLAALAAELRSHCRDRRGRTRPLPDETPC